MKSYVFLLFAVICFTKSIFADPGFCAFCDAGVLARETVFESNYFRVLVDSEPRVRGHLLVIPKRHMAKAHELWKEEWEELSTVIPKIVEVFSQCPGTDQYIILEKNGRSAFQQIAHVHFHLFPVLSQKWGEIFDIVPRRLSEEELEREASEFRGYFSQE